METEYVTLPVTLTKSDLREIRKALTDKDAEEFLRAFPSIKYVLFDIESEVTIDIVYTLEGSVLGLLGMRTCPELLTQKYMEAINVV